MDALSGISMMPGAQGAGALADALEKAGVQSIPPQDLQKLNTEMGTQAATAPASGSFSHLLSDFVGGVNADQTAANDAVTGLMSGKNVSLHQAMISMEEANVSFQMMVEVRNRLLDSYQELMRMQV
jgi:flagellar hook-basal body complex protein FliE